MHSENVYKIVDAQEARDAGVKPLDLVWVDTDKSLDSLVRIILPFLVRESENPGIYEFSNIGIQIQDSWIPARISDARHVGIKEARNPLSRFLDSSLPGVLQGI